MSSIIAIMAEYSLRCLRVDNERVLLRSSPVIIGGELERGVRGECVETECPLENDCSRQVRVDSVDLESAIIFGRGSMSPIE
jgi:hypothetical protein